MNDKEHTNLERNHQHRLQQLKFQQIINNSNEKSTLDQDIEERLKQLCGSNSVLSNIPQHSLLPNGYSVALQQQSQMQVAVV